MDFIDLMDFITLMDFMDFNDFPEGNGNTGRQRWEAMKIPLGAHRRPPTRHMGRQWPKATRISQDTAWVRPPDLNLLSLKRKNPFMHSVFGGIW